jgi:hypothetical protein
MTDSLPNLKSRTRQALGLARAHVLADARALAESRGPQSIIVTHLAKQHDVAPLTVRRWLTAAGFDLGHLTRGRPSFARLADIRDEQEDA